MRTFIVIVILILLIVIINFSCRKETVPKIPECAVLEMERPSFTITATVLSYNEVQIVWQKKGKQTYNVQRQVPGGSWITRNPEPLNTFYYRDTITPGTYNYRVIGSTTSNVVTISTVAPPPIPERTIKIAFDPYRIDYWNIFLQDTTLLGSGLEQWKRDSIMNRVRNAFAAFDITFVTEGPAMQTTVVTQSSEWYGEAAGVTAMNSYGTGMENFVFSNKLNNNWEYIAKAIIHELGHALGLLHTLVETNWMSNGFGIIQSFGTVVDVLGNTVNQPQVINDALD